jgi:hypothetical protein
MFNGPLDHLRAELERIDLLIHREILRLRARYNLSLDEFRGLYIGNEHVDALVSCSAREKQGEDTAEKLTARAMQLAALNRTQLQASQLPWSNLSREFSLSEMEHDILLLAIAPEIDLKYDTLYAYLHNDVTRKNLSCDLACRLLGSNDEQHLAVRRALTPDATLCHEGILCSPGEARKSLGQEFTIAPGVTRYLLGISPHADMRSPIDTAALDPEITGVLGRLTVDGPPVLLETTDPSAAHAAARAACRSWKLSFQEIALAPDHIPKLATALRLQQRLDRSGLLLNHTDVLWTGDVRPTADSRAFLSLLAGVPGPLFLHFNPEQPWRELLGSECVLVVKLDPPEYRRRKQLWAACLTSAGESATPELVEEVAARFTLSASAIRSAVANAADRRNVYGPGEPLDRTRLFEAAKSQSSSAINRLARNVPLTQRWSDLVLPEPTLAQLRDIAAAARNRVLVYSEWGMGNRRTSGTGVKALFSGASGTGKTMSAAVIAADLSLDLYQIDLAAVVSKYIGETEKNLDRIFAAARGSNAVLFFDEADALFGKRSEIKDAHDRYANIEVAYLLQKMEEYDGIAILASNLSRNIDEAFTRRLQFLVEFPLPDVNLRRRLWVQMFPPCAPLASDIDFAFLARQFRFAGGDIRNIGLSAAFLAAADGRVITMKHIIRATARQLMSQGRVPSGADFKQYHGWIANQF